jgi:hypothetical protein
MVFTLTGVDTKSQYLSAIETQQSAAKDERSVAEIESLPEITKSVRKMFETGKVTSSADKSASEAPDEIQRGTAKSLLTQWTMIGSDGTSTTTSGPPKLKPTYESAPGSGVFENEPAVLDGVVRSTDQSEEQVIQRGMTRSLLGQWSNIGSGASQTPARNGPVRVKPTYESAPGSGVFENEPARLEGVVRENDVPSEGEQIQRGFTKSLLNQWQNKGSTEPKYPSRRPIKLAEAEGRIAENEPIRRTDVVREDDALPSEGEQVRKGLTRSLANEWKTKGNEEFVVERKAINVAEAEGKVLENEPVRRTDVVREDDPGNEEGEQIQRGTTRMLLDQWKNIGSNTRQYSSKERTPIVLAEADGAVVENEPAARRTDVAREDDSGMTETEQIQRGMTRSLMNQWKNMGSADTNGYRKERTPINVNDAEGKVVENEPMRRSDVVREDDENSEEVKIQRGTTRNLLSQWKNKSNEEFRSVRKSIILDEDEGRIAENEPEARRSDVVREDMAEGEQIQRGIAKNRLNEWRSKATEEFKAEKKPIVLAEAEGCVAENEPARRTDVVREEDDFVNDNQVQRGLTKSLLSQWKNMGTDDPNKQLPKKTIIVAEGEERIAENEPIRRTDVVRADDVAPGDEVQVKRGTTKSLLNQWKTKGTEEVRTQRKPIVLAEDEGRVLESEPIRLEGVVRADDATDEGVVNRGTTKSLLEQWKNKPNEETRIERRPIVLAEAEGTVAENEPAAQRQDVVRASEYVPDERVVERGFARNLRQQWANKGSEEFRHEKTPILLYEGEGKIAENEPIRRTDVVRADDADGIVEDPPIQKGTTRSLLNRWSSANLEDQFKMETKKPIVVAEDEGRVVESEPIRRDDVVRADDPADGNGVLVRRGMAKNLANQWRNKGSEEFVVERKAINVCEGEGTVAENEPIRREDVVRADDDILQEQEKIQKGLTRSLLGQWKKMGTEEVKVEKKPIILAEAEGKVLESEPVRRDDVVHCDDVDTFGEVVSKGMTKSLLNQWVNKGSEEFVVERKKINVAEGEGTVAENEPVIRTDVIREDVENDVINIQRGLAKSLMNQWKHKGEEEYTVEKKPIILAEAEGTIAENEPVVRSDLIRENDSLDDTKIQRGIAKSLVTQWKHKGEEEYIIEKKPIILAEAEGTIAENEPVVRSDVIRENDSLEDTKIQRGIAKSLVTQWKHKGEEEYIIEKKPIILAEAEGTVAENEPVVRSDLIRENDSLEDTRIQRGIAKSLVTQWKHKGEEEFKIERAPIVVAEGEGTVAESEPVRREDVVRADDVYTEGETIQRGTTKNLLSQWKSKGSEEFQPQRKSIIIADK